MSSFENVPPPLARAIATRGFEALTAVQDAVLAPELRDADLVVSAQTGSGKTVAFGLNLAATLLQGRDQLDPPGAPLALIIAPTRELAMQVCGELTWLYAPTGARVASCVGGMDMRDERRALERGAHIVVGTPGRLVDHIRRGSLLVDDLKAVVLDEADEMLNLGFREELEFILEASPASRRTLMFSATMPRGIEALAQTYQRNAVRVNTVGAQKQHADIAYRVLMTAGHDVENAIFNVLRFYEATNSIVFCGTRAAVTRLESRLSNRGLSVVALSGELSQSARTHALQAMRDHRAQVCVATDVAARGIDLPDLDLVVHADLPKNTEGLLHRSGRTGRAGRKGASVLIAPFSARRRVDRLLRDARIQAQWGEPPSADEIRQRDDERLLGDPLLGQALDGAEQTIVRSLLEQHDPVQIAAAFVRLYRKGQAAPEDLMRAPVWSPTDDGPARERPERAERPGREENFVGGAWIALSVGRSKNAEPRWLIPMLCKVGGFTKRQLGAIRILDHETHVEIDAACIDAFMAQVGEGGQLEKNIRVIRLEHEPTRAPRSDRQARAPREARPHREPRAQREPYAQRESHVQREPYTQREPYAQRAQHDHYEPQPAREAPPPRAERPKVRAVDGSAPYAKPSKPGKRKANDAPGAEAKSHDQRPPRKFADKKRSGPPAANKRPGGPPAKQTKWRPN